MRYRRILVKIIISAALAFIPLSAGASDEKGWYPSIDSKGWYPFEGQSGSSSQTTSLEDEAKKASMLPTSSMLQQSSPTPQSSYDQTTQTPLTQQTQQSTQSSQSGSSFFK